MPLCFYANEGRVCKTMDSVYNTHLNFRSCFSGKKCVLYTGKYGNPEASAWRKKCMEEPTPGQNSVPQATSVTPPKGDIQLLRGCPPKNRPLNSGQNFDFLQNFSTKQG